MCCGQDAREMQFGQDFWLIPPKLQFSDREFNCELCVEKLDEILLRFASIHESALTKKTILTVYPHAALKMRH